jgi:hypothetical protein
LGLKSGYLGLESKWGLVICVEGLNIWDLGLRDRLNFGGSRPQYLGLGADYLGLEVTMRVWILGGWEVWIWD